jgi:hypothetical protein
MWNNNEVVDVFFVCRRMKYVVLYGASTSTLPKEEGDGCGESLRGFEIPYSIYSNESGARKPYTLVLGAAIRQQ